MSQPFRYPKPPRLLIGASVLVWGGLTNHALLALGAALLIEACHWVNWRWRFGTKGYSRAWVLSLIALTGTVGLHSLNAVGPAAFLSFLESLPLIFLPLILAQQYGEEETIPTTVFSVIARKRQERERKLGHAVVDSRMHLGYPYFALTVLSAGYPATGEQEQDRFLLMLLILLAVAIYYVHRSEQRRLLPWLAVVMLVTSLTTASSQGLERLFHWVKTTAKIGKDASDPREEQNTRIGKLGQLKLDRRIHWRLTTPTGQEPPTHLMALSYNFYRQGKWRALDTEFSEYERSYQDLLTLAGEENDGKFAFETEGFEPGENASASQPLILRGAVSSTRKALPSPAGVRLFSEAQEVDAIETNSLGSLLMVNAGAVIDIEIWNDGPIELREPAPIQITRNGELVNAGLTELELPEDYVEADVIRKIVADLKLDALPDREKIEVLHDFFRNDFTYSTHLTINDRQPLVDFLQSNRSGHCEYFGTATTLILRAAGIPARYVVGYAVREMGQSNDEYVIRGTHAHAWCRAYLGGRKELIEEEREVTRNGREITVTLTRETWTGGEWVNIDLTPPDWLAADSPYPNFQERLSDILQRIREDFQIWRSNEGNRGWVNLALAIVGVLVLVFVAWRLSGSRIRRQKEAHELQKRFASSETALSRVLPQLERKFGRRPSGQLLADWLEEHVLAHEERFAFPREKLQRLFVLHENSRFGNEVLAEQEMGELDELVEALVLTCSQSTMV